MINRWMLLLLSWLCWPLAAQTDYIYMMDSNRPRHVYSLVMNSQEYRELPSSPYPLEHFDDDMNPGFQSSIVVTEPGPYLYVGRHVPDQIYGFYRHIDGRLEPLPNFPINVPSLSDPDRGWGGLIWMKKHPLLSVFYTVHTWDGVIRGWRIEADGSLTEVAGSPLQIAPFYDFIQGLDITKDGRFFYLNTFFDGIVRGSLDLQTGALTGFEHHYETQVSGRGMLLSEDDQFLYATVAFTNRIQRYRVHPDRLEPLLPDFEVDHVVSWLWRQGDLVVGGSRNERLASAFLIQPDGQLVYGENSPFDIFSENLAYAAFSPRGDRVYFAGNTYQHAYTIGPNGRLDYIPHSGYALDTVSYGISVAPEIRGDPYSLSLQPPAHEQDVYRVSGDARTPFYLVVNDQCHGPFETNDQGIYQSQLHRQPDLQIEIRTYCEENTAIDRVQTVPVLSPFALLLMIISLMLAASWQRKTTKE